MNDTPDTTLVTAPVAASLMASNTAPGSAGDDAANPQGPGVIETVEES